jgi:6-phospho-3-hexuloisomerase
VRLRSVTGKILQEIAGVQERVDEAEVHQLIQDILQARRIVVCGVGRMGLMSRAFVMRLAHLGMQAYMLGESNTPDIGPQDLLLVNSGSGETQTVVDVAMLGKSSGARLATITARPTSRIAGLADTVVCMPGLEKGDSHGPVSIQPMKTLNEQSLLVILDAIVILLMEVTGQKSEDLWDRHCNLE